MCYQARVPDLIKGFISSIVLLGISAASAAQPQGSVETGQQAFTLESEDVHNGKFSVAQGLSASYGFGCNAENVSPHLRWQNVPSGAKSLVLTMYDPDAPTGIGWMHWVVVNIPVKVSEIPSGASGGKGLLPAQALETRTDFGIAGYGGPCPAQGQVHRYVITLTALSVEKLDVDENAMPALVGFLTRANSLGEAVITVTQKR